MKQNSLSLTEGNIAKVLIRFSVPFLLANLLQALYGAVDLFVIGRFCDARSVAAVSTGTSVTQIITSLISGLTLSGTILVGKYQGMGQKDKVEKSIATTICSFGIFSVILTVVLTMNISNILSLLKTPADAFSGAHEYVFICCLGIFFICEYNALSAILRGYGDSVSPLIFVSIACVCNVVGDFFTVAVLHMGVAGTAIATIASQGISMFCAIFYLNRKNFIFRFSLQTLRIDKQILKEMILIGIPVSFQECIVRISFLYLNSITNSFGIYTSSAVGIAAKYDVFAMLPTTSIANALAALTSQNMGANKKERAVSFVKYGTFAAFLCSLLFFLWAQLSPESMISLFSGNAKVIRAGVPFFRACSFDYLAVSFLFCLNGYLNGREKTIFTMTNCCLGALLVRMPLMYVLSSHQVHSLFYYGLVSPFSSILMLAVIFFYLKKIEKQHPRQLPQAQTSRQNVSASLP